MCVDARRLRKMIVCEKKMDEESSKMCSLGTRSRLFHAVRLFEHPLCNSLWPVKKAKTNSGSVKGRTNFELQYVPAYVEN
jgi:hypothetical protein